MILIYLNLRNLISNIIEYVFLLTNVWEFIRNFAKVHCMLEQVIIRHTIIIHDMYLMSYQKTWYQKIRLDEISERHDISERLDISEVMINKQGEYFRSKWPRRLKIISHSTRSKKNALKELNLISTQTRIWCWPRSYQKEEYLWVSRWYPSYESFKWYSYNSLHSIGI